MVFECEGSRARGLERSNIRARVRAGPGDRIILCEAAKVLPSAPESNSLTSTRPLSSAMPRLSIEAKTRVVLLAESGFQFYAATHGLSKLTISFLCSCFYR